MAAGVNVFEEGVLEALLPVGPQHKSALRSLDEADRYALLSVVPYVFCVEEYESVVHLHEVYARKLKHASADGRVHMRNSEMGLCLSKLSLVSPHKRTLVVARGANLTASAFARAGLEAVGFGAVG